MMFQLPPGVDPAALVGRLREQKLFTDCRGRTLRLSPGNVTTAAGVERLLGALPALL